MKKLTIEELGEKLAKHRKYLLGEPDGELASFINANLRGANLRSADLRSANLYDADLRSANLYDADLYGADLGGVTFLGCCLRIIGACTAAVEWVDAEEDSHGDLPALFERAHPEHQQWLKSALGGEPTPERLLFVTQYVLGGSL